MGLKGAGGRALTSNRTMAIFLAVVTIMLFGSFAWKTQRDVAQSASVACKPEPATCPTCACPVPEPTRTLPPEAPKVVWTTLNADIGEIKTVPYPNLALKHELVFEPGSLKLPRAEVFKQCFVSPSYYKEHFNHNDNLCAISTPHKLFYYHIPKSGSSTSREVFVKGFSGKDYQHCPLKHQGYSSHKKVAIVRDPISRFYAGYDEAFARVLNSLQAGHDPIPDWLVTIWDGFPTYKEYEKNFNTAETLRRFEAFANLWDGRTVFDDHIRLQAPILADQNTGLPFDMDYLGEVHDMVNSWNGIGALVGQSVDTELSSIRGRTYPRRFNTKDVSDLTLQRVCRLAAIDFCCLNFPLPPACLPANTPPGNQVYCQWIQKKRLTKDDSQWFIQPIIG